MRLVSRVDRRDFLPGSYSMAILRGRAEVRAAVQERFAALGGPVSALLGALLLGDRAGIPEEERVLFQSSGSLHVLALSGLHVSILFGVAAFLLSWLPDRRWRAALGALLLLPYLFLAGWSPSLGRAVIMLAAAAVGYLLDRDNRPLDLLALASVLILLADPAAAGELSFQLSFLALLGILLLGRPLARLFTPPLPRFCGVPLAVSLGAQAATAPLLLARFGAAYPAGALAALPLLPLVAVFLWGGLLCIPLSYTPVLPVLAWSMLALNRAILAVLSFFARFPPLRARWAPLYWVPVAAAFGFLLFFRRAARRRP
jgi:ComEC/Rec2-related protein